MNDQDYQKHGYANRKEYLQAISEDFGIDFEDVAMVATLLGSGEDFDGLISTLDDVYGIR